MTFIAPDLVFFFDHSYGYALQKKPSSGTIISIFRFNSKSLNHLFKKAAILQPYFRNNDLFFNINYC